MKCHLNYSHAFKDLHANTGIQNIGELDILLMNKLIRYMLEATSHATFNFENEQT